MSEQEAPSQELLEAHLRAASDDIREGRLEEAYNRYHFVKDNQPRNPLALEGIGVVAAIRGDMTMAEFWLNASLEEAPGRVSTQVNLADVLLRTGQYPAAQSWADTVLRQDPRHALACLILAESLRGQGKHKAATPFYLRAISLSAPLASRIDEMFTLRLQACDWAGYDETVGWMNGRLLEGLPHSQPGAPLLMCDRQADLTRGISTFASIVFPEEPALAGTATRRERLRVGYLTRGEGALAELLAAHDRSAFEIVAFAGSVEDAARMVDLAEVVVDLGGLDDAAAAQAIRQADVDILVATDGYAAAARPGILAYRPAPVQVSFLGFPASMGLPSVDYLIADRTAVPENAAGDFVEKIVWLPASCRPAEEAAENASAPSRAEEGLPEDGVVFCCGAEGLKITPSSFDAWLSILEQVPQSVLWLTEVETAAAVNLQQRTTARGLGSERVIFAAPEKDRAKRIARLGLADVWLDTLPYNAEAAATEAILAGAPVLTQRGRSFQGRLVSSLLEAAELSDLVSPDVETFVSQAVALASDAARLAQVRTRVRAARRSPLFDTAAQARKLEAAYRVMRDAALAGQEPVGFAI